MLISDTRRTRRPIDVPVSEIPIEPISYRRVDDRTWQAMVCLPGDMHVLITIRRLAYRNWQVCLSDSVEDLTITLDSCRECESFVIEELSERHGIADVAILSEYQQAHAA